MVNIVSVDYTIGTERIYGSRQEWFACNRANGYTLLLSDLSMIAS